jgi:ubiquinone/menaquinone biosynthesis C-methylase UbiE
VLPSPYDWSRLGAETYDVVISGQAFEHIEFPWVTMTEVARVLKRGGLVCVIAPSAGPLHRCPVDCWRYYPDGVSALARWANLDVISAETNWNPQGEFVDYSAWWKDTVLVARRPSARGRRRVRSSIRLRALRTTTTSQATRRQSITSAAK